MYTTTCYYNLTMALLKCLLLIIVCHCVINASAMGRGEKETNLFKAGVDMVGTSSTSNYVDCGDGKCCPDDYQCCPYRNFCCKAYYQICVTDGCCPKGMPISCGKYCCTLSETCIFGKWCVPW